MTMPPQNGQTAPPPGWYENNGARQWWDGKAWGPIEGSTPASLASSNAAPGKQGNSFGGWSIAFAIFGLISVLLPKANTGLGVGLAAFGFALALIGVSRSRTRTVGSSVVGLVMSLLFTIVGVSALGQPTQSSSSSSSSSSSETKPAGPTPEQQRDAHMEEQGFKTWQSGETWIKAAEPGSFTCDSGTRCLWYTVASYSGCPAGFYVKADILNENDLAIDWTNEITASVAANEGVAFQLRTMINGSKFRPTEISCMG